MNSPPPQTQPQRWPAQPPPGAYRPPVYYQPYRPNQRGGYAPAPGQPAPAQPPPAYQPVSYGPPPGPPLLAASVKTGPRVGLILWGLIVAVFGAWIMAASAGVAIDAQLALILILAISGLALIVSAVIAALRRPRP